MTELTPKQFTAIEIQLATAPDIQDDLRNYISLITEPYDKVGLDDSIFEFAELVGYRVNNSCEDIAEDLDLEERYGLINDQPRISVGSAFRGHHNKEFMPEYQFYGLFGKGVHGTKINDMIEEIRYEMNGRENGQIGGQIGGRATVETHGDQMRNGGLRGHWRDNPELLEDIVELRNEGLTWKDTTAEFNRRHGTDYNIESLRISYQNNKHLLADKEE